MEFEIKHAFYINLEHRTDRKQRVEDELKKIGIMNPIRFNAIQLKNGNGPIGCSLSHLRCLQIAKEQGLPHVLIVEDDIQFLNPSLFSSQLNKFFESSMSWDVILFAGNNMGAFDTVNDYAIRVKFCQTATGYLVSNHYYDKLIKNMSDGLQQLMRFPKKHLIFAIDQYWKRLQQEDSWFLITPLTVVQREDYSDIEKKHVNYFTLMTRLIK